MKKLAMVMAVIGCIMAEALAMNVSAEEVTTQPDDANYGTDHCVDWMEETTEEWFDGTSHCEEWMEDTTAEWIDGTSHCLEWDYVAPCSGEYNGMHWEYANYVLTISGEGELQKENIYDVCPWSDFASSVHKLVIEDGVTTIGRNVFTYLTNLEEVSIPDTVTSIEESAFYGNCNLKSIVIPDSVTKIGDYAFASCDNLRDVTLSKNLTDVGMYSFYTTPWYTSIQPEGAENVLTIYNDILFQASRVQGDFVIPDGIRVIANHAVYQQDFMTSVTIPDSVEYIGTNAFENCLSMETITIPEGVKRIGHSTFMGCKNLKNITFPASLEYLGNQQYFGKLESITFLNPNCEIGYQEGLSFSAKVYGYSNSTAEELTHQNGWDFVPLEDATEATAEVSGDANGDGNFSLVDVVKVHKMLQTKKAPPKSCDLNKDNKVNVIDLSLMKQKLFK